jgi:phosphate transport system substrate-binding protein
MPADFRVSITNAPGKDAYPISSFTWLLIPTHPTDMAKEKVIKDYLNWMLDHGQSEVSVLDYAPLPSTVADKVRATVAKLP